MNFSNSVVSSFSLGLRSTFHFQVVDACLLSMAVVQTISHLLKVQAILVVFVIHMNMVAVLMEKPSPEDLVR